MELFISRETGQDHTRDLLMKGLGRTSDAFGKTNWVYVGDVTDLTEGT